MKNVVVTQYITELVDHENGRSKLHRHSKSIIQCSSAIEAQAIANALEAVRHQNNLINAVRVSKAGVQLFDESGKSVIFSRDYLEHVLSDLTGPEYKVAAE